MTGSEKVDVVIVGAGAAGAFFAAQLAEAGKSVVVLEAGPAWNMGDLVSSQIWARRLRWGGAPVDTTGEHPFGYGFNAGWGLGGAALHHYGTWPRFHEEDFKTRSLYGRALDWPISYSDLRPFYDRIQSIVGIAGDAEAEIWRPDGAPYPMKPLKTFGQARAIARGFEALGMTTAPMPMAITSEWYNGRPPCIYDGWCDAGCPIGSLYNPLVRDLPMARAHGAHIRPNSVVTRIMTGNRGRATGVTYRNADGEIHEQRADIVILAASVVHNPSLLLNSANDRHPDGVANSSGLVGRYFMSHTIASAYGLFEDDTEPYRGVSGAQLTCRDGYRKDRRETAFGSYQWLIAPAMKPNDLLGIAVTRADLFGADLDGFIRRAAHHIGNMLAMGEDLPKRENRIELTNQRDSYGMRRPRITHRFDQDGLGIWEHAISEGIRVMEAAGAQDPWNGPLASAHMMGGTIMGDSPENSVADSYGRCHDISNLVIAGPGLFPTSGAINPTFTLYALALRSVEHILDHWSDYAN